MEAYSSVFPLQMDIKFGGNTHAKVQDLLVCKSVGFFRKLKFPRHIMNMLFTCNLRLLQFTLCCFICLSSLIGFSSGAPQNEFEGESQSSQHYYDDNGPFFYENLNK